MLSHGATKSLLFVAAAGLADASGGSDRYGDITGAGFRNRLAGVAFTVGSLSMVGMPVFSGFISKLLFAQAAVGHTHKMLPTVIALAISTVLNAVYFMKTVIRIYTRKPMGLSGMGSGGAETGRVVSLSEQPAKSAALVCFILLNLILGLNSDPIVRLIQSGIEMFE